MKKMVDAKLDGRRIFTVRSRGRDQGFGIVNRFMNAFVTGFTFSTRKAAWKHLRETKLGRYAVGA